VRKYFVERRAAAAAKIPEDLRMRRICSRGALLSALGLAAALVGCGSSSSPTNAAARAGFVKQADAVCDQAASRIVKLQAPRSSTELSSAARLLGQELPIATAELSSLRRLAAPGAERGPFSQYLSVAAQEIVIARRVRDFALANEAAAFHEAAAQLAALTPKSDEAASGAGLTACTKATEPHGHAG